MSATLNMELEKGMSFDAIQKAFASVRGCELEDKGKELVAYFVNSNASAVVVKEVTDDSLLTEDVDSTDWRVGARVYLDVDPSRENALEDVKALVYSLANLTKSRFALSFGYETLYALRDTEGLHLSEHFK